MKRTFSAVLLVLVLGVGQLIAAAPVAAAPPPASYTAVLTDDGACQFTLTVTWKNAKVGTVYAAWYMDSTFEFTMQAPFTGPNAGTITGHTATFVAGPFLPALTSHDWHVLVQPYGPAGDQLASFDSNIDTVACSPDGN
jgi:hypothetical protein